MSEFHGIPFRVRIVLRAGGVIAYPTEGVYGLGCDPASVDGVERVIDIKARDASKGLILIADNVAQLAPWVDLGPTDLQRLTDAYAAAPRDRARTYIVPASPQCPSGVTGGRDTVAVRVTHHPVAAALCRAAGSALVSTSANYSGRSPISRPAELRATFLDSVDAILARRTGAQKGVSQIVDFISGDVLRG